MVPRTSPDSRAVVAHDPGPAIPDHNAQVVLNAPLVLMVLDRRRVTYGSWVDTPSDALFSVYGDAVEAGGGQVVMVPPTTMTLAGLDRLLDSVDALFLAGGRDVDAAAYGARPHPANERSDPLRDAVEIGLVRGATERGLPVLGACRGMQVLNVALGGTIEQHLADRIDMSPHQGGPAEFVRHPVRIVAGTRLSSIVSIPEFVIAAHHHQAVDVIGDGLVASAFAPDGVIEALEGTGDTFLLGVQWHPEQLMDGQGQALFGALVSEARAVQASR